MILLFGNKAAKNSSTHKTNSVKNQPVENSGILAMNQSEAKSLLTMGEYDEYISSNPTMVNYSLFSGSEYSQISNSGFLSEFSAAISVLGDCAFASGGFDGGGGFVGASAGGDSCSSFCSVG